MLFLIAREDVRYSKDYMGTSLAVQWLGLYTFTARGLESVPSQGTKIPLALWHNQKGNKNKKYVYKVTTTSGGGGDYMKNSKRMY